MTKTIIQIWWGASSYISMHSRSNQCSAASRTYREGRIRRCIQTWGGRFTFSAEIRANVKAAITTDTEETSSHIWRMIPHHYLNSDPTFPRQAGRQMWEHESPLPDKNFKWFHLTGWSSDIWAQENTKSQSHRYQLQINKKGHKTTIIM